MLTNPHLEVSATDNFVTIRRDDTQTGERIEWSGELSDTEVAELRQALRGHGHALGGSVELRSPDDDALRTKVEHLMSVAKIMHEIRRTGAGS